ncbi:MAG: crotonase/enoyl-CoA hydratase family protein [Pseudomonadales bacterium]
MSYSCFDLDISNNIAHITLSRPEKRNSMPPLFWDELPEAVMDIDLNSKARVIVISSTGPHFTAGLDISAFLGGGGDSSEDEVLDSGGASFYRKIKRMQQSFTALEECRIPVLAAIQGGCIGGGVDLTTACDMRYSTDDAFFVIQETNIGMTADVGTYPRLLNLIPEGIVRELSYTGRRMPAAEAKDFGLLNNIYSDQQTMLDAVMGIAAEIATKAPLAVHGCKHMITYSRDHNTADSLDYIGIWNASMLKSDVMMEAITANGEKRVGNFDELPKVSLYNAK